MYEKLNRQSKDIHKKVKEAFDEIKRGESNSISITIDKIDLEDSLMGDIGSKIIANALPYSKVQYLYLGNEFIHNIGFSKIHAEGVKAIVDGVKLCPSIKEIYFGKI